MTAGALEQAAPDPRVDTAVWSALEAAGRADVVVLLTTSRPAPTDTARGPLPRRQAVYDALRRDALGRQEPVARVLDAVGARHRRFWSVNAIAASVTRPALLAVLGVPGVTRVMWDRPIGLVSAAAPHRPAPSGPLASATAGVTWGVERVGAAWAWSQGHTGAGVVVGGQDTGYSFGHPALLHAYRGYDPITSVVVHDYNWHDSIHGDIGPPDANPCGYDSPVPCDDHFHGTHTMGTIVGNDLRPDQDGWPAGAANAVGVAPGARWVGCRNMDNGFGTPSTYIECFDWLMAPYPSGGDPLRDGDPARAPDIINNSWTCPEFEGCLGPELEPAVDAAAAAGILVVASAGNAGAAGCGTVSDPPAVYPAALAVGATTDSDLIASFSSRGPAAYGGVVLEKPALSAPGVGIRSCALNDGYALASGTSMAGPHVAGAAALLMSAAPALRGQPQMVTAILKATADPRTDGRCGGDSSGVPNNVYGWGIVNARSAIESLSARAVLVGTVTSVGTGGALADVRVRLASGVDGSEVASAVTDAHGAYELETDWGSYTLGFDGYDVVGHHVAAVTLVGGTRTGRDVALASRLRGDCNSDGRTDAGDLSALVLEIFDGDGSAAADAMGGRFAGSAMGCDANADAVIDAGDVACLGLLIFGGERACDPVTWAPGTAPFSRERPLAIEG